MFKARALGLARSETSFCHNAATGVTNTRYADIIAIGLISIAIACRSRC